MESYTYYFFIVTPAVMSVAAVVLGLLRGRGVPRKKLLHSVLLLGGTALVCFGGEAALEQLGMGWRCTPFNIMLVLCAVLLIVMLWRCMNVLVLQESIHLAIRASGIVSLLLVLVITLAGTAAYFSLLSWHDDLAPYNGQMIVCARDTHGGSGSWRYYAHINSIVHGGEIANSGSWWGPPPLRS